ncbi:restriction endonuclease [Agrobacterium sp. MS2]|uniref:McrC family protein n=1 Tax=Agrobacterium sp. MS2 TaxID=1345498 RepID=UPI000DC01D01|nr:restriction endonuclease [Agrobacterium sp. MS2]RAL97728.1 restriction endonuclease [Agrobacterium sp. MS2]
MIAHFTLRERQTLPVGVSGGISPAQANEFARLEPTLPPSLIEWVHNGIRFGPFCGVIRAGNVVVELLPKIDDRDDDDSRARGTLVAMLRETSNLGVRRGGTAQLEMQRLHLLDQFIEDFCASVTTLLRTGAISVYQDQRDNLTAVRGRIDLTSNTKVNVIDRSRIYCEYSERTVDNAHNQALKGTLTLLRRFSNSSTVKGIVAALLHRLDEVTSRKIGVQDIARLSFDRLTDHWRPLFQRAEWLLRGLFPDTRSGPVDGTCLVFNMERLFEGFISSKLRRGWHGQEPNRIILQGPQLHLATTSERSAFKLRPDMALHDGEAVRRIFDAKWKRLDRKRPNFGIAPADIYQLTAYASRYDCDQVALVFPGRADIASELVGEFTLTVPSRPQVQVYAVNLFDLSRGGRLPSGMLPS